MQPRIASHPFDVSWAQKSRSFLHKLCPGSAAAYAPGHDPGSRGLLHAEVEPVRACGVPELTAGGKYLDYLTAQESKIAPVN